jgi:hypothetical protein
LACLALCGLVLLLGLAASASPERATVLGLEGPACLVSTLLGEGACPSCGLTRSTALALHGQLGVALSVHGAGPLVALLALAGTGLALANLTIRRSRRPLLAFTRFAGPLLLVAVLTDWLLRGPLTL